MKPGPDPIDVSVIVPAHNEAENIGTFLRALQGVLTGGGYRWEIIVVDDGSTDDTVRRLAALPFDVKLISMGTRTGNGASVRRGILESRFTYVAIMDADGQHPPEFLGALLERAGENDLVVAARRNAGASARDVGNRLLSRLAGYLSGHPIADLTCGFRVLRRSSMLNFIHLIPRTFSFPTTTTMAFLVSGLRVAFVPIPQRQRVGGRSKIRFIPDGMRIGVRVLKMGLMFRPLRIFGPAGAALIAAGCVLGRAGAAPLIGAGAGILVIGALAHQMALRKRRPPNP